MLRWSFTRVAYFGGFHAARILRFREVGTFGLPPRNNNNTHSILPREIIYSTIDSYLLNNRLITYHRIHNDGCVDDATVPRAKGDHPRVNSRGHEPSAIRSKSRNKKPTTLMGGDALNKYFPTTHLVDPSTVTCACVRSITAVDLGPWLGLASSRANLRINTNPPPPKSESLSLETPFFRCSFLIHYKIQSAG